MFNTGQLVACAFVFVGCCTNVIFLELIIRQDRGAGNLITFTHFVVVALEGLVITSRFFTRKSVIPLHCYAIMVIMFFSVSVSNNHALNYNIALPLHMVFRSSSLVANMILGILILKKRYAWPKYAAVLMITVGITTCTIVTGKSMKSQGGGDDDFSTWLVGIGMLVFALFTSALMGIYQHALPLPGFLILADNLREHISIFANSEPIQLPLLPSLPILWIYLAANAATQYACIRGVFYLTTACPSLTVTLVITLRKFVSLLFSIFYFQNPFTLMHWLGTAFVFGGTLLYMFGDSLVKPREKKD